MVLHLTEREFTMIGRFRFWILDFQLESSCMKIFPGILTGVLETRIGLDTLWELAGVGKGFCQSSPL